MAQVTTGYSKESKWDNTKVKDMVDESLVTGTIKDHDSNPKEKVFVEAYHVGYTLTIPPIPIFYYLGRSEETDQSGEFRITFPTNAYGVISAILVPNIELRIVDQYHMLYKNPIRFLTTPTRNNFVVEIPSNFTYSDRIDHVDWKELVTDFIEDISEKSPEEIEAKLAAFLIPIDQMKYTTQAVQEKLGYRGDIIKVKTSKIEAHSDEIPSDWGEGNA